MPQENTGADASESTEVESQEVDSEEVEGEELDVSGEQVPAKNLKPVEAKKLEKQLKKLKLMVDGEEFEEEFDPNDDEYLKRQLQLAKMGQKRAQSFSELQRDVADFIHQLKTNPKKALASEMVGLDVKKLAAEIIEEEIARSEKSPEQLELEEKRAEIEELRAEQKEREEKRKDEEFEQRRQADIERYDMLFDKALQQTSLPKTKYTVKRIAEYMSIALDNKIDIGPDEIAKLMQDEMKTEFAEMFSSMDEDSLEQLIGEQTLNRVRKRKLEQARAKKVKQKTGSVAKKLQEKPVDKKTSYKDFFGKY